jgi:hypothetical protein
MKENASGRSDVEPLEHFGVEEGERDHLLELLNVRAESTDRVERNGRRNAERICIGESCERRKMVSERRSKKKEVSSQAAFPTLPRLLGVPAAAMSMLALPASIPPAPPNPAAAAAAFDEKRAAFRGVEKSGASSSSDCVETTSQLQRVPALPDPERTESGCPPFSGYNAAHCAPVML